MFKQIFDYFYFSRKERQGIILLFALIFLIILTNIFIIPYTVKKEIVNPSVFFSWADSIFQEDEISKPGKEIKYFAFDPNTLSKSEWETLGLSEKQIKVILNYKKAGGRFYKKEDLKKIYSISDKLYNDLEPYISITSDPIKKKKTSSITKKSSIELNSTDSSELVRIRGIGPVLAKRIIKYRELLGGYYQQQQLNEVYGIDEKKFTSIKSHFNACDTTKVKQLNINTADFKQLLKHPYISYEFVKIIVNERREKAFESLEDFSKRTHISDSVFIKLKPYLFVNTK